GNRKRDAGAWRVLGQVVLALLVRGRLPGLDGAFVQGLVLVGDDQAVIDADDAPESSAGFAGAQRGLEGKTAVQRVGVFDVAGRAMKAVAVFPDLRVGARVVERVHGHMAATHAQRRVEGLHQAFALGAGMTKAILYHVQDAAFFVGRGGFAFATGLGAFAGGLGCSRRAGRASFLV